MFFNWFPSRPAEPTSHVERRPAQGDAEWKQFEADTERTYIEVCNDLRGLGFTIGDKRGYLGGRAGISQIIVGPDKQPYVLIVKGPGWQIFIPPQLNA